MMSSFRGTKIYIIKEGRDLEITNRLSQCTYIISVSFLVDVSLLPGMKLNIKRKLNCCTNREQEHKLNDILVLLNES